jgi:AcrR family transcriptional regulator
MSVNPVFSVKHKPKVVRYIDYLLAQAHEYEGKRSGKRTKLLLFAAAARLFESMPPKDVRVSDICKGAKVSQGTFYLYFQTKDEIAIELMSRFVDFEIGTMPHIGDDPHPFDNVIKIVDWYEATFRINIGIMLCLVQLSDVVPAVAEIWRRRNRSIVDRLQQWLEPRYHISKEDVPPLRLMLHTVGSMMDESLFARFGVHGAAQTSRERDPRTLAELHSVLIYRALFNENPPAEKLTVGKMFLPLIDPG